jgi:hypothetical protein
MGIGAERTSISSFANVRYDIKKEGGGGANLLVSNPSPNFGMLRPKKISFLSKQIPRLKPYDKKSFR